MLPDSAAGSAAGLVVAAQLAAELLAKKTVAQLGFRVDHVTEHLFPPQLFLCFQNFQTIFLLFCLS